MSDLTSILDDALMSGEFEAVTIFMKADGPFVSLRKKGSSGWQCDQSHGGKPSEHLINALTGRHQQPEDDPFDILGDL